MFLRYIHMSLIEEVQEINTGGQQACCTAVPLLKDTLAKGHLSNKDRVIWQQSTTNAFIILPLTKGHLSNKDIITCIWRKSRHRYIREGPLYSILPVEKCYCLWMWG